MPISDEERRVVLAAYGRYMVNELLLKAPVYNAFMSLKA